jgi:hypothetical protein
MLKRSLASIAIRNDLAKLYRLIRKDNPAMARLLRERIKERNKLIFDKFFGDKC